MGVDYNEFACIGYQINWNNEDVEHDLDSDELEEIIQKEVDESIHFTNAGDKYFGENLGYYLFFDSMFVDGMYQLEKQTLLDYVIRKYKLEVIGTFGLHSELDIS